jgi:hypothetical protein
MYLNLELGNFHIVLGKLAAQAAKEKPLETRINTGVPSQDEFFLDDESKLRYQTTK